MKTPIELVLEVMDRKTLAHVCGLDQSSVYYWDQPTRGKHCGFIPSPYIPAVYNHLQHIKAKISLERLCGIPPRPRSGGRGHKKSVEQESHDENV